ELVENGGGDAAGGLGGDPRGLRQQRGARPGLLVADRPDPAARAPRPLERLRTVGGGGGRPRPGERVWLCRGGGPRGGLRKSWPPARSPLPALRSSSAAPRGATRARATRRSPWRSS